MTLKLDFPGNLCRAAFAIHACFISGQIHGATISQIFSFTWRITKHSTRPKYYIIVTHPSTSLLKFLLTHELLLPLFKSSQMFKTHPSASL